MELTYTGGHDAVTVPLPFGREAEVEHGKSYDFPDDRALLMLEQPENWCRTVPEVPLEDRITGIKNHDDANALAPELGLEMSGTTPKLEEKKAALAAALEERNAAAEAAADETSNDDSAGAAGGQE